MEQNINEYDSLLKSMGLSTKQINKTLARLNEEISCDSECKRKQYIEKLKREMEIAKENELNSEALLYEKEKEYYTFKDGEYGYRKMIFERYKKEGERIKSKLLKEFNTYINEMKDNINDIDVKERTYNYIKQLYEIEKREQNILNSDIENNEGIIELNNRKTEYKSKDTSKLRGIYITILIIYSFIVIIYIILYIIFKRFFQNKYYKQLSKWILLLSLIIIPPLVIELTYKTLYKLYRNLFKKRNKF